MKKEMLQVQNARGGGANEKKRKKREKMGWKCQGVRRKEKEEHKNSEGNGMKGNNTGTA